MEHKFWLWAILPLLLLLVTSSTSWAAPSYSFDNYHLDFLGNRAHFDGHVRVSDGERSVRADHAEVDLKTAFAFLQANGEGEAKNLPFEVWAHGNVALDADNVHLFADRVHVIGKDKKAEMTGNVHLECNGLTIQADKATFHWDTGLATFTGNASVNEKGKTFRGTEIVYNANTGRVQSKK